MNNYYYDILINDKKMATVGPSSLRQLHISFGVMNGDPVVKAGAVSACEEEVVYINWLEETVGFDSSLQVTPSKNNIATSPLMTKKLGQTLESIENECTCDFCNRAEVETGKLISLGSSPLICVSCVKRCAELAG